jgi:hypothetical protein
MFERRRATPARRKRRERSRRVLDPLAENTRKGLLITASGLLLAALAVVLAVEGYR